MDHEVAYLDVLREAFWRRRYLIGVLPVADTEPF